MPAFAKPWKLAASGAEMHLPLCAVVVLAAAVTQDNAAGTGGIVLRVPRVDRPDLPAEMVIDRPTRRSDDQSSGRLDPGRDLRLVLLAGVVLAAIVTLHDNAGSQYGFDFRGIWGAARAMLSGHDPYPPPLAGALARTGNPYVLPPLFGLLCIPTSHLSFTLAVAIVNVLCVSGFAGALYLLGVRDPRVYVVALCSFPFVSSLALGQPDGLFALAAAVAWRYRDSPVGALAIAVLIAVKLLAWPLLLWLVFTRRFRMTMIASFAAIGLLFGSWAIIGFQGLEGYGRLLAADARGFETRSHSVVAFAWRLGIPTTIGAFAAVAVGACIAAAIVYRARDKDLGAFVAALTMGLLISPILWSHYIVILLVPLAIRRRRLDAAWLVGVALWLSPTEPPKLAIQIALVLAVITAIALLASADPRPSKTTRNLQPSFENAD